jgi:hypothetical protein
LRYRLIKPEWAKEDPDKQALPNIIEGEDFTIDFLKEKNNLCYNVYYFPNHNKTPIENPFLSGKDVSVFKYCFVDMDLKDGVYKTVDEFVNFVLSEEPKPNRLVFSGNGVHAYWNISDLTLESYIETQLKLIKKYKTDKSIWTVLQLMRLPGFYNTKDKSNFKLVEETQITDKLYQVSDLKAILPDLNSEERA